MSDSKPSPVRATPLVLPKLEGWSASIAALLDVLSDSIVALDPHWRYIHVNPSARDHLRASGVDVERVVGRQLLDVLPHLAESTTFDAMRRARRDGIPVDHDAVAGSAGRWFTARFLPLPDGTLLSIARDVTHGMHAEHARIRAELLQRMTAALSGALVLEDVARIVLDAGLASLHADAGNMAVLSEDGQAVVVVRSVGHDPRRTREWEVPISTNQPIPLAIRTRQIVSYGSSEERTARFGAPAPAPFESGITVPLIVHDRVLGTWGLSFRARRGFDANDIELLSAIARQAAIAVDRAHLLAAERQAREAAVEANAAKANFLAVMSHELRTPLTAIIGYTELLADGLAGPVTPMQRDQLGRVKASSLQLLTVIEEILSYARIEAGREAVRLDRVDLRDIVRSADAMLQPLADRKGISYVADLPDEPVWCTTDADRVRQIIVNLAANAVKFTEVGEVRVEARKGDGCVSITVRDTGIGIASEHLDRVFDAFWQVEQGNTRRVGGTGLGLSVARRLATLLGGELKVESGIGQGSTFTLRLPA